MHNGALYVGRRVKEMSSDLNLRFKYVKLVGHGPFVVVAA
jgi:hypothetical protein